MGPLELERSRGRLCSPWALLSSRPIGIWFGRARPRRPSRFRLPERHRSLLFRHHDPGRSDAPDGIGVGDARSGRSAQQHYLSAGHPSTRDETIYLGWSSEVPVSCSDASRTSHSQFIWCLDSRLVIITRLLLGQLTGNATIRDKRKNPAMLTSMPTKNHLNLEVTLIWGRQK